MEGIDLTSALLTREAHEITFFFFFLYIFKFRPVPAFYKQTKILYKKFF